MKEGIAIDHKGTSPGRKVTLGAAVEACQRASRQTLLNPMRCRSSSRQVRGVIYEGWRYTQRVLDRLWLVFLEVGGVMEINVTKTLA